MIITNLATFVKSHFTRLDAKTVYYRNFKTFDENSFLNDLSERHAPLKKRFVGENQTPFMNKGLRKAIYTRSKLKSNFCKKPTKENEKKYKIQRNKLYLLESIKKYLRIFPKMVLL